MVFFIIWLPTLRDTEEVLLALATATLTTVILWTTFQLRSLKPSAKISTTILSIIGLAGFPVISLYSLYVIYCNKGRVIPSQDYQHILRAAPEILYRTSAIVWIGIMLILMFMLASLIPSIHWH